MFPTCTIPNRVACFALKTQLKLLSNVFFNANFNYSESRSRWANMRLRFVDGEIKWTRHRLPPTRISLANKDKPSAARPLKGDK